MQGRSGENRGRIYGVNVEAVGKCVGVWGEVRGDVERGVKNC